MKEALLENFLQTCIYIYIHIYVCVCKAKCGLHRVDADVLDLYQQRVAQLVPRLRPPHIPAFCAALPAHSRGVLGGAAPAAPPPPPPQANGTSAHPHSASNASEEVPGGLRQRPARAPAAALDQAGLEAVHRQQNLQARTPYHAEPGRLLARRLTFAAAGAIKCRVIHTRG